MPTGAGGVDQLRSEPLHPSVQRHVVDLDATLGHQFLEVPIRQPEAQLPPDGQQDHLRREPEARESRGGHLDSTTATTKSHPASGADQTRFAVNATVPGYLADPVDIKQMMEGFRPARAVHRCLVSLH
jgi:hypothetical protein